MLSGAALKVLVCFDDQNSLNFTEICERANYPTDLGGYYIRQLVAEGCLVKTGRGLYEITAPGKQQLINRGLNSSRRNLARPRLCVMALPILDGQYVIIRRRRQPYIGFAEWPATAVLAGQALQPAIEQLLLDRLQATGQTDFKGFFRRIDTLEKEIFDDKIFAVYTCQLPRGQILADQNQFGKIELVPLTAVGGLAQASPALVDILQFSLASKPYYEQRYNLAPDETA